MVVSTHRSPAYTKIISLGESNLHLIPIHRSGNISKALAVSSYLVLWTILSHDVYHAVWHVLCNPVKDGDSAALKMVRHDKVTDDDLTELRGKQMIPRHNLEVVLHARQTLGTEIISILKVREPYIEHICQETHGLLRTVQVGIPELSDIGGLMKLRGEDAVGVRHSCP